MKNELLKGLQKGIYEILKTEAPLAEAYLLRRILPFFGKSRVSDSVRDEFDDLMYHCELNGIIRKNGFLYLKENLEIKLRIPGKKREAKYISIVELASGILSLLDVNEVITREDLVQAMVHLLGYSKTGDVILQRLDRAIDQLKKHSLIKVGDDIISRTYSENEDLTFCYKDIIEGEKEDIDWNRYCDPEMQERLRTLRATTRENIERAKEQEERIKELEKRAKELKAEREMQKFKNEINKKIWKTLFRYIHCSARFDYT